jgi:hypothetical protein
MWVRCPVCGGFAARESGGVMCRAGHWVPFLRALPRDHVSGRGGRDWRARVRERCANAMFSRPAWAREHVWTMLERLEGRAPEPRC